MFFRTTSSAFALMAFAFPALADVTPAEVWQNWVDYYKANGYTVTEGTREEAGETLSVKDVAVSFAAPDDQGAVSLTFPEITLSGTGDGKVRTTFAETSPFTLSFKNEEDEPVSITGNVVAKNAEIVTSGSAADMTHATKAAEFTANLTSIKTADKETAMPVTLRLLNVAATQRHVDGDAIKIDFDGTAERLEVTADVKDLEDQEGGKGSLKLNGGMDNLASTGSFVMPKGVDIAKDMNAALKAGLSMDGTMSAGAGKIDFQFDGTSETGEAESGSGTAEVKGVELTGGMSAAGLKYQGSSDASSVQFTSPQVPVPVSYALEGSTFDLQMPIMKSDQPAPFKFAYSLSGLTIADGLWDLFDSAKVLPRDPASLDVDVTGLAKVTMDLFDPASMKAMEDAANAADAAGTDAAGTDTAGTDDTATDTAQAPDATATAPEPVNPPADGTTAPAEGTDMAAGADAGNDTGDTAPDAAMQPFEPTEININKFAIDAVGAKVDVSGALTVPEGGSLDAPVGKVNARLDGVNGLIDKAVQMGFVPEDQVAGIRMMLAMFAKPAPEGGDVLVGEYEFKEGGQVFANGQQVK